MKTMELRAIRKHLQESPPPAPSGTSMREWFAGLALMNPMLMAGIPAAMRAAEAVRLADELIAALAPPRVPSLESMAAPTETELKVWDAQVAEKNLQKERASRDTCPAAPSSKGRKPTMRFGAILPPPIGAPLPPAVMPPVPGIGRGRKDLLPAETRYCSITTTERVRPERK